ncbi:hypothetical protein EDB92DRAFT_840740 [Lactarius akahatsu]|uniref:F-box domain-containing protein n=1 Tax=Lactarius akahatsu TaxID=416441 RepID=A0AAD4QCR0_9AGAM|nr:hypothetical protein EDB92DRAFT_840740 [Lactarius akahatsu]
MDPDHLRQAIDAEIKSLEASIQALRYRRNALAPFSSLPTEVITTIFSFLHIPVTLSSSLGEQPKRSEQLAWLRVAHVCHQWREIALNHPLLWNHVDFTIFSSAGAAEILSRAKRVPLYLEARVPCHFWDNTRFSALQKELQDHVSQISHLRISAESFRLHRIFKGLVLPAPTLELLSLSGEENTTVSGNRTGRERVVVPDTLFDGSTPRLSYLELCNCDTSWNSPLLWGLKHLYMRTPFDKPDLSVWLDALGQMPQLKTLVLCWASPVAPPGASLSPDVDRTVTLPSLTLFDISSPARDCGLALAHLILPALTSLCLDAKSYCQDGSDVQEILPYVARHAHGPQDAQPLQSMWFSRSETRAKVLAWTLPDMDVDFPDQFAIFESMPSARVAFSVVGDSRSPGFGTVVFDLVTKALPLDGIVTLTAQNLEMTLYRHFWLLNAPRWPLLQRVRLTPIEERGFMEMLLDDHGGRESPLLPSLTTLILDDTVLLERRTLHLCDALMKRVEQGVALETLDLRKCLATSHAIELLSEIVVDVLGPAETFETDSQIRSESYARGICLSDDEDENSVVDEDNASEEDSADTGSDDEVWDT